MPDADFVDWCYRQILRREADESGRRHYVQALERGLARLALIEELFTSAEYEDRFAACRIFPPGHPLSPLPNGTDIEQHRAFDFHPPDVPAVDLRTADQWQLLQRLATHYPRLRFNALPQPGARYYFENTSYSYADAVLLGCMMLEIKPRRIIEVGSGFSSAAMLDVNDAFFDGRIDLLFIDPDATRLRDLLSSADMQARVIEKPIQDVPIEAFDALGAGDILFIDSSHVSKLGSDVNHIFFTLLPRLAAGVFVHVHDVLYPFEYPHEWLRRGWVWNEQYLLHAFLQYNPRFAIRLLSSMLIEQDRGWFAEHMPDCLKNTGGCLWMEKV